MGLLPELDPRDVLVLHCPVCPFHSHLLSRIEEHFDTEHPQETVDFAIFRCSVCLKVASSRSFLSEHLTILHEDETEGGIMTYFSGKLYSKGRHQLNGAASPRSQPIRSQKCIFCSYMAPSVEQLQVHYSHHGVRNLRMTTPEASEKADTTTEDWSMDGGRLCLATRAGQPILKEEHEQEIMDEDISVEDVEEVDKDKVDDEHGSSFGGSGQKDSCRSEGSSVSQDAIGQSLPLNLGSVHSPNSSSVRQSDLFHLFSSQHHPNGVTPNHNAIASSASRTSNAAAAAWYAAASPLGHMMSSPILSTLHSQFGLPSFPLPHPVLSAFSAAAVTQAMPPPPNSVGTLSSDYLQRNGKPGLPGLVSSPGREMNGILSGPNSVLIHSGHYDDSRGLKESMSPEPCHPIDLRDGECGDTRDGDSGSPTGSGHDSSVDMMGVGPANGSDDPSLYNIRRAVGLTRTNLPFPARKKLFNWLVEHLREPYPSEEEKLRLALETGLSRTTVNNWFINARRRYVKPLLQGRLVLQSGVFKTVTWNGGSGGNIGGKQHQSTPSGRRKGGLDLGQRRAGQLFRTAQTNLDVKSESSVAQTENGETSRDPDVQENGCGATNLTLKETEDTAVHREPVL